jgi:hypothetical protein
MKSVAVVVALLLALTPSLPASAAGKSAAKPLGMSGNSTANGARRDLLKQRSAALGPPARRSIRPAGHPQQRPAKMIMTKRQNPK